MIFEFYKIWGHKLQKKIFKRAWPEFPPVSKLANGLANLAFVLFSMIISYVANAILQEKKIVWYWRALWWPHSLSAIMRKCYKLLVFYVSSLKGFCQFKKQKHLSFDVGYLCPLGMGRFVINVPYMLLRTIYDLFNERKIQQQQQ